MTAVPLLAGCQTPDEAFSCEEQEKPVFPEMQEVAESTFDTVADEMYAVSGCAVDETGLPDAQYVARVDAWHHVRLARAHLKKQGWVAADRRHMSSPDGHYHAYLDLISIVGTDVQRSVLVTFSRES